VTERQPGLAPEADGVVPEAGGVVPEADGVVPEAGGLVGSDGVAPGAGRSSSLRWGAVAVGVVVMALVALLAFGSDDRLDPANDVLGRRVPDVSGPTLDGGTYDIDDARGKWVIVNFFATWCPGCVNEHPELVAFNQWAEQTGRAEVVAVVFNDPADAVRAFFDENGGGWPVVDNPALALEFQVAQIPETFVVAPSGQVVEHIQGEVRAGPLIELIEGSER
jgi:cytochrome c biogenesis protein CcmG/thiol:disulfide interchange protein DsbE